MDSAGPEGGGRGRRRSPYSQQSCRKVDQGPCHWRSSRCFPRDQKASRSADISRESSASMEMASATSACRLPVTSSEAAAIQSPASPCQGPGWG
ncbi:hypothetical protein AB1E18_016991 [Capra hircus]